jgi:hypothetical protein
MDLGGTGRQRIVLNENIMWSGSRDIEDRAWIELKHH